MKKFFTILFVAIVAMAMTACNNGGGGGDYIPVENISVSPDEWSMNIGDTKSLTVTVLPSNATNQSITWSSDDISVATVSGGVVTAVSDGTAIITATSVADGTKTAACTVTVLPVPHIPVVYVAGQVIDGGGRAALWVDGVLQILSTNESNANSVFVSGDDVYVVGQEFNPTRKAMLWKNGIAQTLSEINTDASSVFVSGDNNIYVAGSEYGSRNVPYARFWENGQMQILNEGSYSRALAVYGSGDDVYVAGYESTATSVESATLWVNGQMQTLSSAYSFAYSVYVAGDNVYVGGYENNAQNVPCAAIWENGVIQILDDGSEGTSQAYSVFASDSNVYATGFVMRDMIRQATVWKNGVATTLSTTESWPQSIFVSGDDTYVVGYAHNAQAQSQATLWVNGTAQTLSENTSSANSVFVK